MTTDTADGPNEPYTSRIDDTTDTIDLDDGRTLAYCEFGDPTGSPVFVFHGGVGSRGFGLLFDDTASDLGVRIIAADRPGYGRSDPQPDRTLLDWPDDVSVLGDALGLDAFSVLGVSGGGPWAAACAAAIPDRLTAVGLVSAMGPPAAPRSIGLRLIVRLARHVPWVVGLLINRQLERAGTDPAAAIAARATGKAEPEAALHRGPAGRQLNAQTAEAGSAGVPPRSRRDRHRGSALGIRSERHRGSGSDPARIAGPDRLGGEFGVLCRIDPRGSADSPQRRGTPLASRHLR